MPSGHSVVLVTVPDLKSARRVTHALLRHRLAACVNRIPRIESRYWWEGKIEESAEILLLIKTRASLLSRLTRCIRENHPYSVPEVVALPIQGGHAAYLDWISQTTASNGQPNKGKTPAPDARRASLAR